MQKTGKNGKPVRGRHVNLLAQKMTADNDEPTFLELLQVSMGPT